MSIAQPVNKRWTRGEYYRLGEMGCFEGERTELIHGEIYVVNPQSFGHYAVLDRVAELLAIVFADDHWVRIQGPLSLVKDSEPEPDVSVVTGRREDYSAHPTTAELIVEVSATTIEFDRNEKANLYAASAILDYWIVNLGAREIEVHREPSSSDANEFGHGYGDITKYGVGDAIAPLALPTASISVADVFSA
ncbi:MAG: Uma2 family endonuclease [Pirellulales bacterium]|nr:Uma2 family endonuclease [Pirellulales bacterium]